MAAKEFPLLPTELDAVRQSRNNLIDQNRKLIYEITKKLTPKYQHQ